MHQTLLIIADILSAVSDIVSRSLKWVMILLSVGFILFCLVVCVASGMITPCLCISAEPGLEATASRLEFEPSFKGLAEYINKTVKPEMTREEVAHILENIGPLTVRRGKLEQVDVGWGPTACDHLVLCVSETITMSAC